MQTQGSRLEVMSVTRVTLGEIKQQVDEVSKLLSLWLKPSTLDSTATDQVIRT